METKGTTFWLELPLATVASPAPVAAPVQPIAQVDAPSSSEALTILYIEDNLSNLRLVERILIRRPEVKLLSAVQGSIGIDLARQNAPDLIFLDLHLPDIMGDVVYERLCEDPRTRDIPVVVVSADAITSQVARLRFLGVKGYLTKPIDVRAFLAIIDQTKAKRPLSVSAKTE